MVPADRSRNSEAARERSPSIDGEVSQSNSVHRMSDKEIKATEKRGQQLQMSESLQVAQKSGTNTLNVDICSIRVFMSRKFTCVASASES